MSTEITTVEKSNQVTKADIDSWLFGSNTKLTESQKTLFYQIAISCQLNPAKREVYAIPYGNNFNIIVGYEVYLKRAERTGNLEWWEAGVKKDGQEYIGFCTIKRRDRAKETTIEAWFNEYNQNNTMWKTKPRTMIRKVAIAQAFRMVFPDELGGLPYTADEIDTGSVIDIAPQPEKELTSVELMIKALNAAGKLGNAEKFIGKPSSEWTDEDIDKIEAAKKKNGKSKSLQAPPAHDQSQSNGNARGENDKSTTVSMATSDQIEKIIQLAEMKDMPIEVIYENYLITDLTDLTADNAYSIIDKLATA